MFKVASGKKKSQVKSIDVLFINPRDLAGSIPYIKLASAAGVLKSKGISFDIIEPAASKTSHAEIISVIREAKPSIVCLSAFPSTLPDAFITVNLIKKHFPNLTLVLEGYFINANPEILLSMGVEYGFRDDMEFVFAEFCGQILATGKPDKSLPGLVINCGETVHVNERANIRDIDSLPMPAYEYLPIGKYYSASHHKNYMILFTARGCPYECNFCSNTVQMNYRRLSVENTLKQLVYLVKDLGVEWVEFMDLTFSMSKQRTIEICDAIIKEGLIFDWGCETRVDKLDKELLLKMKEAGCKKITFGVESGVERIRYQSGKSISNQKMIEMFVLCKKNGVKAMANFIFGHPGETAEDMKATVRFARELDAFNVLFTKMLPLPDVEVYKKGIEEGIIEPDAWIKYMRGEIELPVYYPVGVSQREMESIHRWAYLSYYLSPYQIKKYLPLFTDVKFMAKSLAVFWRFAFGKTTYK